MTAPTVKAVETTAGRWVSIDAYRGFVMLLMMAEVLRFCAVAEALPENPFWQFLCYHQSHAPWRGCRLHDLIQPSFYFLVGVVLPLSLRRRRQAEARPSAIFRHAAMRAVLLVGLGILMLSLHRMTLEFVDTLTQIGLAYPFVFALAAWCRPRTWAWTFAVILVGYWLVFALYPLPPPGFDFARGGVSDEWLKLHGLEGFQAHWQIISNVANAFDRWWLNLLPRGVHGEYWGHLNGLTTLNFVPSIATMILGLFAGHMLMSTRTRNDKLRLLGAVGLIGIACGWALGRLGVCPVVKAIWTPSWVLFSGGWCCLLLAGFHWLFDESERRRWALPLVVIGSNSIVAYVMAHVYPAYAFNSIRRIVGADPFRLLGPAYEPLLYGSVVLGGYWIFLYILHRQRLFIRV